MTRADRPVARSTSDWISLCALACAVLSAAIALYALRGSRRANAVELLDRRVLIYNAFKRLATEALCRGAMLSADELEALEPHARAAEVHLPEPLAAEVTRHNRGTPTTIRSKQSGVRGKAATGYAFAASPAQHATAEEQTKGSKRLQLSTADDQKLASTLAQYSIGADKVQLWVGGEDRRQRRI
jgi:hypothetical protein